MYLNANITSKENLSVDIGLERSNEDIPCNLLPANNNTYSFASNWENIPETFLFNGLIAVILYTIFIILTRLAWSEKNTDDEHINPSLISTLYGYRDPDRWYVIPRFEFLRRSGKRHEHDMTSTSIYVPPKLPLSNPIDLLNYDSVEDSVDSTEIELRKHKNSTHENARKITGLKLKKLVHPGEETSFTNLTKESSNGNSKSVRGCNETNEGKSSSSTLDNSFVYPSILAAEQHQASYLSRKLNQFFGIFFKVTDADIIYAKGIDAYEYLLFQRHLIFIMFITNILCLCLLLPVHWYAYKETNVATSFQRTTIKNMRPNSIYYWTHLFCSVLIVIVSVFALKSYRESTISKDDAQLARRTLLIGNIQKDLRNRIQLIRVFKEYFPDSIIEAIQFVYDTSTLETYYLQLAVILVAKDYCSYYRRKYNRDILVKPTDVNEGGYCGGFCRLCSLCLVCCYYWPRERKQLGSVFYAQREQYLRDEISKTFSNLEPSEYAFVTFKSHKDAKKVMKKLANLKVIAFEESYSKVFNKNYLKSRSPQNNSTQMVNTNNKKNIKSDQKRKEVAKHSDETSDPLDPKNNPHIRSIRSPFNVRKGKDINKKGDSDSSKNQNGLTYHVDPIGGPVTWSSRYAPHPDNVEYEDLLHLTITSRYTIGLLYIAMVIIFIFVTTPNVILSFLDRLKILNRSSTSGNEALLYSYLSVLLQIIATNLLPFLIGIIAKQIPYEDTASKNHSMMWKIYLFLVLMVIIMPSIGMNSAQTLLSSEIKLHCLFPADNGAYFINYVVSSTFLSTFLELIKPVDILSYCFIYLTGRSQADFESGRQCISREFSVSMQHTGVLLIFSAVMTYSISCPLIAPAGLLYLLVKHAVDHYQLFYTYFTKKVDKNLQNTITLFVRVALILMLFQTTVAITINTGTSYFSFCSQIIFLISAAVFSFKCFTDCTSAVSRESKKSRYQRDFCACFYLPRVMEELLKLKAIPESCISRKI